MGRKTLFIKFQNVTKSKKMKKNSQNICTYRIFILLLRRILHTRDYVRFINV